MDEIDSLLSKRSDNEHEASRRIKTEFMVQLDGAATVAEDRILVMGATNLPHNLDDAVLRRLSKRVYVPLPDLAARAALVAQLLPPDGAVRCALSDGDRADLVARTERYSCSDVVGLCKEASMGPVRDLLTSSGGAALVNATAASVRPVTLRDFTDALRRIRPSVSPESLQHFKDWEREHSV
jgi:spastin